MRMFNVREHPAPAEGTYPRSDMRHMRNISLSRALRLPGKETPRPLFGTLLTVAGPRFVQIVTIERGG